MHASPGTVRSRRRGVILLVVITLLTLFAVVGVTFVIFAQAEASSARVWREGESTQRPDMDPEMLLAYFLSQLAYGTDNQHSALRGHSLGEAMYGPVGSTAAFNGSGRLHTNADVNLDDYYQVDYTNYTGGAPRDPHASGGRNPPYTYPDFNNLYLAAVRASDGAVLMPSYYRPQPAGMAQPVSLSPRASYHTGFVPGPDGNVLAVKNLADSPGYLDPATGQFINNDSPWIDAGFPVMKGPDGRKFKPLFAPLIVDLDGRVNVNANGNWACLPGAGPTNQGWNDLRVVSHEGWGPWEVNPSQIVTQNNEARNLFRGNGAVAGKFHDIASGGQWGTTTKLNNKYMPGGCFYAQVDFNSLHDYLGYSGIGYDVPINPATTPVVRLPGVASWISTFSFPWFHWQFHNGGSPSTNGDPLPSLELSSHPRMYNYFDPEWSYYGTSGKVQMRDRSFSASHLEALLRYGDRGSPAMTSDLFSLCPTSFATAKTRRQVTTHSFDLVRPGVAPYLWNAPGTSPYSLSGAYPQAALVAAATATDTPQNTGDYGPTWNAIIAGLGRIDLNRPLPSYPAINGTSFRITDTNAFTTAQTARQNLATDIFNVLRRVTGAGDPNNAALPAAEKNALRWLAQLSANIVDFIDNDNYMTPFKWGTTDQDYVFGTELPWVVLNEAYAELGNTKVDLDKINMAGATASDPFKMRFWVELHNPMDNRVYGSNPTYTWGLHPGFMQDNFAGRLEVPVDGGNPAYAVYQLAVSTAALPGAADNVRGDPDPDPNKTKLVVASFDADPGQNPAPVATTINVVNPINGAYYPGTPGPEAVLVNKLDGPDASNAGYYLLGPEYIDTADEFPGTAATKPKPTLRVKKQDITYNGQTLKSSLVYTMPNDSALDQLPQHTLALRRLACPHLPPQPDPAQARYNPYITVDYIENVPTNDAVRLTSTGVRANAPASATDVAQRYSVGRNQPFAAHSTQIKNQKPGTALVDMPQHTMFKYNVQVVDAATNKEKMNGANPVRFPLKWLRFADRPMVSPYELLVVSGYKPHELTQKFMGGGTDANTGEPTVQQGHIAPWTDGQARIHRLFEFLEGGYRMQMSPVAGRAPGRININTVWDVDTFRALCDPRPVNLFTGATPGAALDVTKDVDRIYDKMVRSRSKGVQNAPSATDKPFMFASADIEDTLFRRDPDDPTKRMFEVSPALGQHPHFFTELLRKIGNNVTTRSNCFAVFLTVGFFEVLSDGSGGGPPQLGREIGRAENRHVRHRMFAVVDRSNLALAINTTTRQVVNPPAAPAQAPFFLESETTVTNINAATAVTVPTLSGIYEGVSFSIAANSVLVIDAGDQQEIVQVTSVAATNPPTFTATFTKRHQAGFSISNAVLGHPGPQSQFDPRNPKYSNIVRHFSVIE